MNARREQGVVTAAGFLRSVAVGMSGVLVAIDLASRGWDVRDAGVLVSAGLAGIALNTLLTSLWADRFGRRRTLLILGALSALGGLALVFLDSRPLLLVAAFVGMVNGLGRDRGPAYALDQAVLSGVVSAERRTFALAWYSMLLDIGLAVGSLLAGLPFLLRRRDFSDCRGALRVPLP